MKNFTEKTSQRVENQTVNSRIEELITILMDCTPQDEDLFQEEIKELSLLKKALITNRLNSILSIVTK